jgi:hypothetical protein
MKQNRTKSTEELIQDELKEANRRQEEAKRLQEEAQRQIEELTTRLEKVKVSQDKDRSRFDKIRQMSISKVEDEGLSYLEFVDSEICEYADMEGILERSLGDTVEEVVVQGKGEEKVQATKTVISTKTKKSANTTKSVKTKRATDIQELEDREEVSRERRNPFPLDKSNNLINGPMQCGKTKRIQTLSFAHMLFNKCSSVVILRNSTGDANQLKIRCDQFAEDYKKFIRSKFPRRHAKTLEYVYVGTSSVEKLRESVNGGMMIIVIANPSQMSKLEEVLVEGTRYITMIDEADLVAGAYSEEYPGEFRKILHRAVLKNSGKTYAVTATTFDLIFSSDEIKASKVFEMKINPNYRGLEKIQLCRVGKFGDDDLQPTGKSESCFTTDIYLRPLLEDLSKRNEYFRLPTDSMYSQVVSDGHPMVLLIKNTRLTEKQRELLNEIVENDKWNWTEGIVYNGGGLVIQSKYLRELKKIAKTLTKPFKVKYGVNIGEAIVTGTRQTRHDALEKGGKRCLYIKENISFGMQCFRELIKSGVRITHLVIIADRMADRGISFVSSDYKLRLTCQYYVPSSTATVTHKLQAIRLCGVYNDNLPSMLFAPPDVCEDLVKANLGQKELISRLKSSGSDEGTMTVCSGFKYSKSKLPKCKWGAAKMPCRIVEGSDGGVSRKRYNSALEDIKPAEGVEHLVKEEEDEEKEEHNGYQSDPDWLPNKCIFRILQENICSGIYKKVLDATIIVLKNIGKGKWHTRTDVVSKLLESKIEGWDVCYGDKFRARLSDFCTKKQFHQIITDDDSKGLLFKQIGSRWQLRLN